MMAIGLVLVIVFSILGNLSSDLDVDWPAGLCLIGLMIGVSMVLTSTFLFLWRVMP
jgi:hypothetical protein